MASTVLTAGISEIYIVCLMFLITLSLAGGRMANIGMFSGSYSRISCRSHHLPNGYQSNSEALFTMWNQYNCLRGILITAQFVRTQPKLLTAGASSISDSSDRVTNVIAFSVIGV